MPLPSPLSFVATRLRERLVRDLTRRGTITSRRVAAAMVRVPRHVFVPEVSIRTAYQDRVVLTKEQDGRALSTLSQPSAVGRMLQDLRVERGMRVLEIGSGTGYNAALLAELTGDPALVTTVDIDRELVERTRRSLATAGYEGVNVVHADGFTYEPDQPVDRIELSVEAPFIAPGWIHGLLEGGLILLPLRLKGIRYFAPAMRKRAGRLRAESDSGCAFVSMRSPSVPSDPTFRIPGIEDAEFTWEGQGEFPAEGLAEAFGAESSDHPDANVPYSGMAHAVIADDNVFTVTLRGRDGARELGFYDDETRSACLIRGSSSSDDLKVRCVGGVGAHARLIDRLREWNRQGRPQLGDREILAYPVSSTPSPEPGWRLVRKPHFNLLIGPVRAPAAGDQSEAG